MFRKIKELFLYAAVPFILGCCAGIGKHKPDCFVLKAEQERKQKEKKHD